MVISRYINFLLEISSFLYLNIKINVAIKINRDKIENSNNIMFVLIILFHIIFNSNIKDFIEPKGFHEFILKYEGSSQELKAYLFGGAMSP